MCKPRGVRPIQGVWLTSEGLELRRFWLGDGVPLLSSGSMQSMLTPTVATDSGTAAPAALGLGWFLTSTDGHRNLHHGGGTNASYPPSQSFRTTVSSSRC